MKKILAYIVFAVAIFAACWFGLIAVTTPYNEPSRGLYILGLCATLVVAMISMSIGNSIPWKKDKE